MASFTSLLAAQARRETPQLGPELDEALRALDQALEQIADELQVEYYGPGIGVEGNPDVYRLVVRAHAWTPGAPPAWSMKICDGLPNAGWRAAWAVQGAARLRKAAAVRALPAFFAGYLGVVEQAGKHDTPAGRRLAALAAEVTEG